MNATRLYPRALAVLAVASAICVVGSQARAQLAFDIGAIDTNLTLENPSALTFYMEVKVNIGTESFPIYVTVSDDDDSTLSGTALANFDVDFSSGNMVIDQWSFTGGSIVVDQNLTLSLGGGLGVTVTGTGLQGSPFTSSPPSTLNTPATPGEAGDFDAGDHGITIDQGVILASGYDPYDLSGNPISDVNGPGTGIITVVQGAVDMVANTTTYSVTVELPVDVMSDITAELNLTDPEYAHLEVNGTIQATVADVVFDWIPWNGVAGDVDQNGSVGQEDVDAFVAGWLSTNTTPGLFAYEQGDLNFDGVTDLTDAFLLHDALVMAGSSAAGSVFTSIPEPATGLLLVAGIGLLVTGRSRRQVMRA